MTSLSERNTTARPVRRTDDYLIYRTEFLGRQSWVVVMFDPFIPSDNVRFIFPNRAEATQALYLELGDKYSPPPFWYLLDGEKRT